MTKKRHPGSYHTPKIHTIPVGDFLREIDGTWENYKNTIPGGSLRDYIRIVTLLISFQAILKRNSVNIKLSIVTILESITLEGKQ